MSLSAWICTCEPSSDVVIGNEVRVVDPVGNVGFGSRSVVNPTEGIHDVVIISWTVLAVRPNIDRKNDK